MQAQGDKCDTIYISFTIFLYMALCNLANRCNISEKYNAFIITAK